MSPCLISTPASILHPHNTPISFVSLPLVHSPISAPPPDLSKKPFFAGLVDYFSSGPIVAMVWEGPEVILTGRKMLGATNPNSSEPGQSHF